MSLLYPLLFSVLNPVINTTWKYSTCLEYNLISQVYIWASNAATPHLQDPRNNHGLGLLSVWSFTLYPLLSRQNMLVDWLATLNWPKQWVSVWIWSAMEWQDWQNCQDCTSLALSTRKLNSQISIITRSIIIRCILGKGVGHCDESCWGNPLYVLWHAPKKTHTHTQNWGKRRVQRSKPLAGESINSTLTYTHMWTHTHLGQRFC